MEIVKIQTQPQVGFTQKMTLHTTTTHHCKTQCQCYYHNLNQTLNLAFWDHGTVTSVHNMSY